MTNAAAPRRVRRALRSPVAVVVVTFLVLLTTAGMRSAPGVLIVPIELSEGWSRDTLSNAVALNLVVYGLTAPFAAALIRRFGIAPVATAALLMVAMGSSLTALIGTPHLLFVTWGLLIGLGTGAIAIVFGAIVANTWFVERRGLVIGIFSGSSAAGQLIFLPLLSNLAINVGWRITSFLLALFALLLLVPVQLTLSRHHEGPTPHLRAGQHPAAPAVGRAALEALAILRRASKERTFWVLAITFFICGWSTNGLIGTHFIPAAHDHGMPVTTAASLLAIMGAFDLVGTIASGWLTDRVDPRYLLVGYYGLRGVSLFIAPLLLGPSVKPSLFMFMVLYGLDWVATVPPTATLSRAAFGDDGDVVFGWVFCSHMVGAGIAAWYAGLVRQVTGAYNAAWVTAALLCLVASILMFAFPARSARRQREPVGVTG